MAEPAEAAEPEVDPRRVRIGLAIIAVVIVVAIGLAIAVDSAPARVIFAGVAVVGVLQTWRLYRAIRS